MNNYRGKSTRTSKLVGQGTPEGGGVKGDGVVSSLGDCRKGDTLCQNKKTEVARCRNT